MRRKFRQWLLRVLNAQEKGNFVIARVTFDGQFPSPALETIGSDLHISDCAVVSLDRYRSLKDAEKTVERYGWFIHQMEAKPKDTI